MKAQIVFANMTGNDEDMVEILEENLQDAGFDVKNTDVSFVDAISYLDADLCVMVTYTYGEGVMTDELKDSYDQLIMFGLSGKRFAVMDSGDKTYKDHYCENIDSFEGALVECGAVEVAKPVRIKNAADGEDIDLVDQVTEEAAETFND